MENTDKVDRIALEAVRVRKQDAVLVNDEVVALGKLASLYRTKAFHDAAEHWHALGVTVFQFGAQDGGQITDILGDQEVVLHEALDVLQAGMLSVAKPHGDLALDVERQPLFGTTHEEVHVAAHGPQEVLAAPEQLVFLLVEDSAF